MSTDPTSFQLPLEQACLQLSEQQSQVIRRWLWKLLKSSGALKLTVELLQATDPTVNALSPSVREAAAAMIYSPMPLQGVPNDILAYCIAEAEQTFRVRSVADFFAELVAHEYTNLNQLKQELLSTSPEGEEQEFIEDRIDDIQGELDELVQVLRDQFPGLSLDQGFQTEVRNRTPDEAERFLQNAHLRGPDRRRGGPEGSFH